MAAQQLSARKDAYVHTHTYAYVRAATWVFSFTVTFLELMHKGICSYPIFFK